MFGMYDTIFTTLDSIPTVPFLLGFLPTYLALFPLLHHLLLTTASYSSLEYKKQSNILCNLAQLTVLIPISFVALTALWREDVSLVHTDQHKNNVQVLINISSMYVTKDVVEIFINKKIANTTIIHHICVICAYIYCISVLTTDFKVEGIFKNFIGYAGFTCLDFPYEIFLALRFFISRTGSLIHFLKRYVFFHNLVCVTCNFSWQTFYFLKLVLSWHLAGTGALTALLSTATFLTLLSGWVQEEIVLMKHLWQFK